MKSLTGLGQQKIDQLLTVFSEAIEEISNENYRQNKDKRSRRPGGGSKGKLPTPEEKLFFILFYLKNYPTFDVLGFIFDLNPSKAEENVKKLFEDKVFFQKTLSSNTGFKTRSIKVKYFATPCFENE